MHIIRYKEYKNISLSKKLQTKRKTMVTEVQ